MPLQRAYIYFFNDEDQAGLHASSGITRHFQAKPSFYALSHLQRVLGDYYFARIVTNQPGRLRAQEYRNDSGHFVWVVWSPTGERKNFTTIIENAPGTLLKAERMPLAPGATTLPMAQDSSGRVELEVGESPVYLVFEKP